MIRPTLFRGVFAVIASCIFSLTFGQDSGQRVQHLALHAKKGESLIAPKIPKSAMPELAGKKLSMFEASAKQKVEYKARLRANDQAFIENKGQWNSEARYLAKTSSLDVWMTDKGWVLDSHGQNKGRRDGKVLGHVFSLDFQGTNAHPLLLPNDQRGSVRDYMGPMTKGKISNVRSFGEVVAKDVYPGIDINNYVEQGKARFDFIVKPGVDPSPAHLHFSGTPVAVDRRGSLIAKTRGGNVEFGNLRAYQYVNGARVLVPVAFKKLDKDTFGFELGAYDKSKELTIDPTAIAYGTMYGGEDGWDECHAIVTDLTGGVYVTGLTRARQFPRIQGPYSFSLLGSQSAFMTKLQGDVYSHDFAVYFGGQQTQSGDYLQIDPNGDIWVAGMTDSTDFPGGKKSNVVFIDDLSFTPPTFGKFFLDYADVNGPSFAIQLDFNASPAQIKAAIDGALGSNCIVTAFNGGLPGGSIRIELPNNFPGVFSVDDNSGTTGGFQGFEFPEELWPGNDPADNTGPPIFTLVADTAATAGTFQLRFILHAIDGTTPTITSAPLAFNATTAQVQDALNSAIFTATGNGNYHVTVVSPSGALPTAGVKYVVSMYFNDDESPDGASWADNLTIVNAALTGGSYSIHALQSFMFGAAEFTVLGQAVPAGTMTGKVRVTIDGANSADIDVNANLATIQQAVSAITGVGTNVTVTEMIPGTGFYGMLLFSFNNGTLGHTYDVTTTTQVGTPYHYGLRKPQTPFFMRWKHTPDGLLDPQRGSEKSFVLDGDSDVTLQGFGIVPALDNSGRVVMGFGGRTDSDIGDDGLATTMIPGYNGESSYIGRLNFDPNGAAPGIQWDLNVSRYIGDQRRALVRGVAVDAFGNQYVAGTVFNSGTFDTSLTPVFQTTAGVFAGDSPLVTNGRLLRNTDIFVRKYSPNGSLIYSGLIGGDGNDVAAGWDIKPAVKEVPRGQGFSDSFLQRTFQRVEAPMGSAVAVDNNGNAYVIGLSGSFDFPRTRGVFGEVFTANQVATVTKISSNGSNILYSTHLHTGGNAAWPGGIAVDLQGNAFITGNVHPWQTTFPKPQDLTTLLTNGFPLPSGYVESTIVTTSDAAQATKAASPQDLPSSDGFLNVLNSTATGLVYGTYIGASLDEEVRAPYVDSFGDCWVSGYSDGRRFWDALGIIPFLGSRTAHDSGTTSIPLPAVFITPLAFKPTPDAYGDMLTGGNDWIAYGILDVVTGTETPVAIQNIDYRRDGFLVRFRVSTPIITSVTFDDPTIAGGLGSSTTGHVNLSAAAPAGGMNISVSLSSTVAASFDPVNPVGQRVVSIAAGQTTASFPIYTSPVTQLSNVDVKAEFLENFKVGRLVVAPWLSQFTVTPSSIVGGNPATGSIKLFQTASQPITVTLLSDKAAAAPPLSVIVPTGQSSVNVLIPTTGVSSEVQALISASLLGYGPPAQLLKVEPCNLSTLTFSPARVSAGASATGTIKLDGLPGAKFDVTIAWAPGTPGAYPPPSPTKVTFDPTDGSPDQTVRTFTVQTANETSNQVRTVIASRTGQAPYVDESISGNLNVDAESLVGTGLTITPNPVNGGDPSSVKISLTNPADTGGVNVHIESTDPSVTLGDPYATGGGTFAQVEDINVHAGDSSVTVPIHTTVISDPIDVTIKANLSGGPVLTGVLHVNRVGVTISLNPSTVTGGSSSTGTVTIGANAPTGGTVVAISDTGATSAINTFPTQVTVPQGKNFVTFTITTNVVTSQQVATFSASVGAGTPVSKDLTILPPRLTGLTFTPARIRGGPGVLTTLRLTFNATPPDNTKVYFTSSNAKVTPFPVNDGRLLHDSGGYYLLISGATSSTVQFTIPVNRVSRVLATTITATYGTTTVSSVLTSTR